MSGSVQTNALALLEAIYGQTAGDVGSPADSEKAAKRLGMNVTSARAALNYLFGKGLLKDTREMAELPAVFITAMGVDAIEGALAHPFQPTRDFPSVNIINVRQMTGGAIQQGTVGSTQSAEWTSQSDVSMADLASDLALVRTELLKVAKDADDFSVIGRVADAEKAAASQDSHETGRIISALGAAGEKVLDAAMRVGAESAVSCIKTILGLP